MNNEKDPGLNHNQDSNPEHTNLVKQAFVNLFNKIDKHQNGEQEADSNGYEFPDDLKDFDAADYINKTRALDQEHSFGEVKQVPGSEDGLEHSSQDLQDSTRLLGQEMTGDQLIGAIDAAKAKAEEEQEH